MMEYICDNCNYVVYEKGFLIAKHPFIEGDEVYGCPNCREITEFRPCCEEDGCINVATCGKKTEDGYRHLCGEHYRM